MKSIKQKILDDLYTDIQITHHKISTTTLKLSQMKSLSGLSAEKLTIMSNKARGQYFSLGDQKECLHQDHTNFLANYTERRAIRQLCLTGIVFASLIPFAVGMLQVADVVNLGAQLAPYTPPCLAAPAIAFTLGVAWIFDAPEKISYKYKTFYLTQEMNQAKAQCELLSETAHLKQENIDPTSHFLAQLSTLKTQRDTLISEYNRIKKQKKSTFEHTCPQK